MDTGLVKMMHDNASMDYDHLKIMLNSLHELRFGPTQLSVVTKREIERNLVYAKAVVEMTEKLLLDDTEQRNRKP